MSFVGLPPKLSDLKCITFILNRRVYAVFRILLRSSWSYDSKCSNVSSLLALPWAFFRLKVEFDPIMSNWKQLIHHLACSYFFSDGVRSAYLVDQDQINCLKYLIINAESPFDIFYHWRCNVGKFDAVSESSCSPLCIRLSIAR